MLNKPPASSLLLIVMLAPLLHSVIWCGDLTTMTLRSLNYSLTVYINDITPLLLLLLLLLLFCCSSGILVSCYCLHYTMVRETVPSIKYCCWFCLSSVNKVHILLKWCFMHYHYMVWLTTMHPFNIQVYISYFKILCVYCALECVIMHAMIHKESSWMLTR